jgi:hypothetical protein
VISNQKVRCEPLSQPRAIPDPSGHCRSLLLRIEKIVRPALTECAFSWKFANKVSNITHLGDAPGNETCYGSGIIQHGGAEEPRTLQRGISPWPPPLLHASFNASVTGILAPLFPAPILSDYGLLPILGGFGALAAVLVALTRGRLGYRPEAEATDTTGGSAREVRRRRV